MYPAESSLTDRRGLILEIGPGRGDFLFHLASEHPQETVVGIEIKRIRFDKLVARIEQLGLDNVVLIQDDARRSLPRFFDDGHAATIHINFPDPWPKRRHGKNRVMNEDFIAELHRVLAPGGALFFQTDVEWYAKEVAEDMERHGILLACQDDPASDVVTFPTYFLQKWKKQGRTIWYQKYRRA